MLCCRDEAEQTYGSEATSILATLEQKVEYGLAHHALQSEPHLLVVSEGTSWARLGAPAPARTPSPTPTEKPTDAPTIPATPPPRQHPRR